MPRAVCTLGWWAGLCASLLSAAADETGWTRFRGPNGSGVANNQNMPVTFGHENILWKTPIVGLGHSSPVVCNDYLFLQTSSVSGDQRMLLCIDASTGKPNWSRSVPAMKATKHANNTFASSTPVTDGTAVYVAFWDGRDVSLVAYNVKGDLLWSKNLGPWLGHLGAAASPILYKDKVIFFNDTNQSDKGKKLPVKRPSTVLALHKKTGAVIWEIVCETPWASYATPFLLEIPGKAPELVVASFAAISGFNPDNGSEIWTWRWRLPESSGMRVVSAPFVTDGLLFAFAGEGGGGGGERQMYAIALSDKGVGETVWQNKKDFPHVPCCLTSGVNIYFVNDRGFAGCYEAKTGKRLWLERLPAASFIASPVLIDGKVYAASEQGDIFVFAAEPKFQLLARNNLEETIRATPAVTDGRLFIRGQRHLFCIGNKKRSLPINRAPSPTSAKTATAAIPVIEKTATMGHSVDRHDR